MNSSVPILVEISPGELWDKITILRIKTERIVDIAKLLNVRAELAMLEDAAAKHLQSSSTLEAFIDELSEVNGALWDVEDEIRHHERRQDFCERFIELARSVYRLNDKRGAVKRRINEFFDARILEEKQYVDYQ